MSTRRPYRAARTKEEALKEIKVVDILVDMLEEEEIEFEKK